MVIWKPQHAQLRHPLLRDVDISDAAAATTIWDLHLVSFRDLLRRVAIAQRVRYPHPIPGYPKERENARLDQAPYGFQLLLVRGAELSVYMADLAYLPSLIVPCRSFRTGCWETLLVVDGWSGEPHGLLAITAHKVVQLEGALSGIEEVAWSLFQHLGIVLDATGFIRHLKGPQRSRYDQDGWTEIPGIRSASGRYLHQTRQREKK